MMAVGKFHCPLGEAQGRCWDGSLVRVTPGVVKWITLPLTAGERCCWRRHYCGEASSITLSLRWEWEWEFAVSANTCWLIVGEIVMRMY
jgi:hypothetical protein